MVGEMVLEGEVGGTGVEPWAVCALHAERNNAMKVKSIRYEKNVFSLFSFFPKLLEIVINEFLEINVRICVLERLQDMVYTLAFRQYRISYYCRWLHGVLCLVEVKNRPEIGTNWFPICQKEHITHP